MTKNWLGDILFQIPALEALRENFPGSEIFCAAPERCRQILEAHPAVTGVLTFDEKKEHRFFPSRIFFGLALRARKWDQAYLFHRSRTRAFLTWLAGARERIGYASGRKWFLTRAVEEPSRPLHQVDYFLELLTHAGLKTAQGSCYRFYFSKADRAAARKLIETNGLEAFACFHLGANWEPKRWPTAHFAELADRISERSGLTVVLTGAARDRVLGQEVLERVRRARVVSLIGRTSLGELGALYQQARFVVSGDSGPMHIASGAGAPVVALFGPTDPGLTGPRGTGRTIVLSHVPAGFKIPWYGETAPKDWLAGITPAQVSAALEEQDWFGKEPAASPVAGLR